MITRQCVMCERSSTERRAPMSPEKFSASKRTNNGMLAALATGAVIVTSQGALACAPKLEGRRQDRFGRLSLLGEGRKIRPDPRRPIDLIGAGPIVLPPTQGFRGRYEVIHGRVEDLA